MPVGVKRMGKNVKQRFNAVIKKKRRARMSATPI
jgi:hypothetical protein